MYLVCLTPLFCIFFRGGDFALHSSDAGGSTVFAPVALRAGPGFPARGGGSQSQAPDIR